MIKLLIVDDEPDLREVLALEFEMMGHEVSEASNGHEAYERILSESFDLILCDLRMPQGGGIELLERVQSMTGPRPAIILMTGLYDLDDRDLMKKGAFGVVSKPFNWTLIRELVGQLESSKES